MAERRMFAKTIIDSDAFIDMPVTARLLYYDLAMRADDDGFVNAPKKIMRMVGASQDDLSVLILRKFLIPFENGIVVIKHWRIHNYLRKDRYTETKYTEQKELLECDENNAYRMKSDAVLQLDAPVPAARSTDGIPMVDERLPQDRLGKDRIGKDNNIWAPSATTAPPDKKTPKRFIPPSVDDVRRYCHERGNGIDAAKFVDYYNANGWKVGRNNMKDWQAAVRNWERNSSGSSAKPAKQRDDTLDGIL